MGQLSVSSKPIGMKRRTLQPSSNKYALVEGSVSLLPTLIYMPQSVSRGIGMAVCLVPEVRK